MIVKLLLVFVGGGLGSVARFLVSLFVPKVRLSLCSIPLSTLCVNVLGCLAIGFLAACFASQPSERAKLLLVGGFCGGFTTFSTFSLECIEYLKAADYASAGIYMIVSLTLCILSTLCGVYLSKLAV